MEAARSFFSGQSTKKGGGRLCKGLSTKEKRFFLNDFFFQICSRSFDHYTEGGGGLRALVDCPLKKEHFFLFASSLRMNEKFKSKSIYICNVYVSCIFNAHNES